MVTYVWGAVINRQQLWRTTLKIWKQKAQWTTSEIPSPLSFLKLQVAQKEMKVNLNITLWILYFSFPDQVSFNQALAARALLGLRIPTPTSPPAESPISPQLLPMSPIGSPNPSNNLLTLALAKAVPRRPRGEKKPIPEDLKDNKYFERRKRNNLAAKKSRDQRKIREDQICQRATMLEKENAVLRAQVRRRKYFLSFAKYVFILIIHHPSVRPPNPSK